MDFKKIFSSNKKVLTDSEKNIIRKAFDDVSKGGFQKLYFDSSDYDNYTRYGFKSKDAAIVDRMNFVVEEFIKTSNYLGYVISNSEKWHKSFRELDSKKKLHSDNSQIDRDEVLSSFGGLTTVAYRLREKDYVISYNGKLCYPGAICKSTPEETRLWFVKLLEPLLKLR